MLPVPTPIPSPTGSYSSACNLPSVNSIVQHVIGQGSIWPNLEPWHDDLVLVGGLFRATSAMIPLIAFNGCKSSRKCSTLRACSKQVHPAMAVASNGAITAIIAITGHDGSSLSRE